MTISIPNNFQARPYQAPLYNCLADGYKRGVAVWHRRAGKDKTGISLMAKEAFKRKGSYYYFYPLHKQARKAIWDGMDKSGFKYTDHFPKELIEAKNESDMKITLRNGSIFQLVGTDNYDAIMSTNPIGCVFSEYSLHDPMAWEYVRPILAENGGWALFLYTPRGENHGFDLYEMARTNPEWFCQTLTVDDTEAVKPEDIDAERQAGMSEEMIQQEFYCSFQAPLSGSYYANEMTLAMQQGRIRMLPTDTTLKVHTFWDLGISDYMAIWFAQFNGPEIHLVDYYQGCNEGMGHYAHVIDTKRIANQWILGEHWAPHDIEVRELSTGVSRRETARQMGIDFNVVPNISLTEGIEAVRRLFPRCWFDDRDPREVQDIGARKGINCLKRYTKKWNEAMKVYSDNPLHDENSHGADAFRTLANAVGMGAGRETGRMTQSDIQALNARHGRR
jgi:hypothetical protein